MVRQIITDLELEISKRKHMHMYRESNSIADRIGVIRAIISEKEQLYRRKTGRELSVTLVAVSKRQPDVRIEAALNAGQRVYGENRVQEAQTRWARRRDYYKDLKLHLIGPLQTNKVGDAVALFDVIEVVDRPKLAKALGDEMIRQNRQLECYVQVNTGEEVQKSGIAPDDADDFIAYCRHEVGLNVTGLMCIPPIEEEAAMHFALLNIIAKRSGLAKLSMGMSDDFEDAIAFGASAVRVGSAIFGVRDV